MVAALECQCLKGETTNPGTVGFGPQPQSTAKVVHRQGPLGGRFRDNDGLRQIIVIGVARRCLDFRDPVRPRLEDLGTLRAYRREA